MKKKYKYIKNLNKMTNLQWYIFDSQSVHKGKKISKNYHSKLFWHKGRYGGLRRLASCCAYDLLPKTDAQDFNELEARFRFLRKTKKMRR